VEEALDGLAELGVPGPVVAEEEEDGGLGEAGLGVEAGEEGEERVVEPGDVVEALVVGVLLDVGEAEEAGGLVVAHEVLEVVQVELDWRKTG